MRWCAVAFALMLGAGCGGGDGITRHPVAGAITVSGQPLRDKIGSVLFKPDAAKGNTSTLEPTGPIDKDGTYILKTKNIPGAPAGWYKVVVNVADPGHDRENPGKAIIHRKFSDPKLTPLAIEVVPAAPPKTFDLNLTP